MNNNKKINPIKVSDGREASGSVTLFPPDNTLVGFFIMEQWKDIKGYKGMYQVSNYGNVKSFKHTKKGIPLCER